MRESANADEEDSSSYTTAGGGMLTIRWPRSCERLSRPQHEPGAAWSVTRQSIRIHTHTQAHTHTHTHTHGKTHRKTQADR